MKNKKIVLLIVLLIVLPFILAGCVPGDGRFYAENPAGLIWGFWHGLIAWISFLIGLFVGGNYTIYETFNNGWPYNLGFLLGAGVHISGITGGIVRININSRRRHHD